jgi:spermidine synthase
VKVLLAALLAALSGFIALSYEICWVRAYSFLGAGSARVFGVFLGSYLAGLAAGAHVARRYCDAAATDRAAQLGPLALYLLVANVAGFLLIPLVAAATPPLHGLLRHDLALLLVTQIPVLVAGALLGTALPLIAHFAIPADERAGLRLSWLYLGNILGSAAGSLLTGYLLMDVWPLRDIALFLAILGLALSAGVALLAHLPTSRRTRLLAGLGVAGAAVAFVAPAAYDGVYERLLFKSDYREGTRFARVVENRSGVICVASDDRVYGGGAYDGGFNVDPVKDTNGIRRAYALAALHPDPREVLVIGLGSGSWAQVLAHHPSVKEVVIVEINPGYLEVVGDAPEVETLLDHPAVTMVIDDGRRWLRRNGRRFDAIVQNTTHHWRGHVTNLVSREYLEICRAHLKPGGVLYYNTTQSDAVQRTGAVVFPHAVRFRSFLAVSDAPMPVDRDRWARAMAAWRIDGRTVVAPDRIGEVVAEPFEDRASILERTRGATVITDDNMASEWFR